MKNYNYFLFDLDGTISDTHKGIFNCVNYACDKLGIPRIAPDVIRKFIGPPLKYSFSAIAGYSEELTERAIAFYRERYVTEGVNECELYPGIKSLLIALKNGGKKIILATAKPQKASEQVLKHLGITELFDFVSGEVDGIREVKNQIIEYGLSSVGINDKQNAVMIGDRYYDAEGAVKTGLDCIGAGWGFGTEEELLNAGAFVVAKSAAELADIIGIKL